MSKSILLSSTILKKYWMAITGLFLCTFLIGHLIGNLQLFIANIEIAKEQFNQYAHFMSTNPLIKVLSYITYFGILFHTVDGVLLVFQNKKARGNTPYIKHNKKTNTAWSSRNMGLLGTIVLVFIILHMNMFWAKIKFGDIVMYKANDGRMLKDLYTLTIKSFQLGTLGLIWTLFYAVSMVAVGFHLSHGFSSAFQSLGLDAIRKSKIIKILTFIFSIIVPLLFAVIPFYIRYILIKI